MVRSKTQFPKEGEFIVGKVTEIENQYVYVDLIDYTGLDSVSGGTNGTARGMIHISEISSRWIKNIRNFVRIGQRIVLKVLRVDPVKGHVDLSLRRVNSAQRNVRIKEWKYGLKYENLLQFLAESTNKTLNEIYESIGFPILDKFKSYQEVVEELKENGAEILKNLNNISEDLKQKFLDIVNENVKISTVSISGNINLSYLNENGIDLIKETLIAVKNVIKNPKETRYLTLNYISAPHYRLEIVSKDYLDAENILSEVKEIIELYVKKHNGTFEFIRD